MKRKFEQYHEDRSSLLEEQLTKFKSDTPELRVKFNNLFSNRLEILVSSRDQCLYATDKTRKLRIKDINNQFKYDCTEIQSEFEVIWSNCATFGTHNNVNHLRKRRRYCEEIFSLCSRKRTAYLSPLLSNGKINCQGNQLLSNQRHSAMAKQTKNL